MTEFTPLSALVGGGLIGFASLLLLLLNGKVLGISGIVSKLGSDMSHSGLWRWFVVTGIISGPLLLPSFMGNVPSEINLSWEVMVIAGMLVGFGSHWGSGCTSGHGICGLGRLSTRSIVATIVFMCAALLTVFLMRHVWGL